jgi:hypothetical protein
MLEAALDLARHVPVFPCKVADKAPYPAHGFKDATQDPARENSPQRLSGVAMDNVVKFVDDALKTLDPKNPMASARALVRARFVDGENRQLLHHHRGAFWQFQNNHYAEADDDTVRAAVWEFLEDAKQMGEKGPQPFKPTRDRVSNVIDALKAACYLDTRIDPPAWLGLAHDLPPASEMLGAPGANRTAAAIPAANRHLAASCATHSPACAQFVLEKAKAAPANIKAST